jgi:hypothetical protein
MSSIREQIIEAAMVLLNTGTPGGVPATQRARMEDYTPEELPAITIKAMREEDAYEKEGARSYFLARTFTLRVEVRVAGPAPDQLADPLLVWAGQVLGGQVFPSGAVNLATDCVESLLEFQYASEDQPYVLAQLDFRVYYSTLKGDPTAGQ